MHASGDDGAVTAALVRDGTRLSREDVLELEFEAGEARLSWSVARATHEPRDVSRDRAVGVDAVAHRFRLHAADVLCVNERPRFRGDVLGDIDPRGVAHELRREFRLVDTKDGREDLGCVERPRRRGGAPLCTLPLGERLLVHADVVAVNRGSEHHAVAIDDVGSRRADLFGHEPLRERRLGQRLGIDALDHHEPRGKHYEHNEHNEREHALAHHRVADACPRRRCHHLLPDSMTIVSAKEMNPNCRAGCIPSPRASAPS